MIATPERVDRAMRAPAGPVRRRMRASGRELQKVGAFVRRDFLVAWSYRMAFFTDALMLLAQVLVFSYVSRLVDPTKMPSFGGTRTSYMAFVSVGIALTAFMSVGLGRMVSAIRAEQYMGTLESLLVTPTSQTILQLGSVAYDLVYVPIRTGLFLLVVASTFGSGFQLSGLAPTAAVVILFVPFVWGLGVASAAGVLTFRRGSGLFGAGAFALTFASGAYFPLELFPRWVEELARFNPIAIALDAARLALLGGAGWGQLASRFVLLALSSSLALAGGTWAFKLALKRERRLGTVGLY